MRHRTLAVTAVIGIATLMPAGAANAAAPHRTSGTETMVMTSLTINGADAPSLVVATGPIHGVAIETQTYVLTPDGPALQFTLHFAAGTVTALAEEDYSLNFDPISCTATSIGTGTWTISGGTGSYAGVTGGGTFTDRGRLVGARDRHGVCQGPDSDTPPLLAADLLHANGHAVLSSR